MARQGRRWLLVPLAIGGLFLAGDASAQSGIRWVTGHSQVKSSDGAVLYQAYCAVCHGPAARGDGAAARHLRMPVPDLTRIAARDGLFDGRHIGSHIRFSTAKGESMPDVRQMLIGNYQGDRNRALLAESNLTRFLEGLQAGERVTPK